jgi:hypothetical protein
MQSSRRRGRAGDVVHQPRERGRQGNDGRHAPASGSPPANEATGHERQDERELPLVAEAKIEDGGDVRDEPHARQERCDDDGRKPQDRDAKGSETIEGDPTDDEADDGDDLDLAKREAPAGLQHGDCDQRSREPDRRER